MEGCVYNFEAAADTCERETYLPCTSAQAKLVNMDRTGLDQFVASYNAIDKQIRGANGLVVDLSSKVKNPGPYDFAGVLGKRFVDAERRKKESQESQVA